MKFLLLLLSLAVIGCDSNVVVTANVMRLEQQYRTQCLGGITLKCRVMELNYQMAMAKYYRNLIEVRRKEIVDCNGEEFYSNLFSEFDKQINEYQEAKPGWFERVLFSESNVGHFRNISILTSGEYDHLLSSITTCDLDNMHDSVSGDTTSNVQPASTLDPLSTSLEDIFGGIENCSFNKNLIVVRDDLPTYPYFIERGMSPYKIEQSLQYFNVDDELFGIHVSEVILPHTWNLHAVTFDVPLDELLAVLREKFGGKFEVSEVDEESNKPKISINKDDPQKSVLYCDEP